MSPRLAVLALVALALATAGCLGPDGVASDPDTDPGDGAGTGDDPDDEADGDGASSQEGFATPEWSPGLWWRYNVTGRDGPDSVIFAVQRTSDDRYRLLANGTGHAAADAVADLAYVGPVRTRDLAGIVDGEAVRFYDWPLDDGRTWETTWNGLDLANEATRTSLEVPGGTIPGVEITGIAGNETATTYTYAPGARWFTSLEVPGRNASYELTAAGFGYGGNLTEASASSAAELASPATRATTFPVPEDADRVTVQVEGAGDQVSYDLRLVDPNGTSHEYGPVTCQGCEVQVLDLVEAIPGDWSLEATLGSAPTGNLTATVSVVQTETVEVDYG